MALTFPNPPNEARALNSAAEAGGGGTPSKPEEVNWYTLSTPASATNKNLEPSPAKHKSTGSRNRFGV